MSSSSKFKMNLDLLKLQQKEFTKGGVLLRNIFSISPKHPVLSVVFALAFGVIVNALYDFVSYPFVGDDIKAGTVMAYGGIIIAFAIVCAAVIARLRVLHKDLFVDIPLSQKKVLISLVSKGGTDFKDTPAYNTLQSLLYGDNGQAAQNALQKVVLVTTELPEVTATANDMKTFIESGSRQAELYGITINSKSLLDIQKQMDLMLTKVLESYAPHEIVVDYTGGTKDMSIALLRASEKALILPIYLNNATDGQHSKY